MTKKKKIFIIIISTLILFVGAFSALAEIIARLSVRGEVEVTSTTLSASATYTSQTSSYDLAFTEAGDSTYIDATVTNNTAGESLHVYHEISITSGSDSLAPAIMVYYNGEFVGPLNQATTLSDPYRLIAPSKSLTDRITFELHNSADEGLFDHKSCAVTITTYTENMDYEKYILVTNSDEFVAAVNDINSGYLTENPTIVLQNNITVSPSITISNPATIHTNGYTLTASVTVNDTTSTSPDALLAILGTGSITSVALGANYDVAGAKNLIKDYALEKVNEGLAHNGSLDIIGPYGFYGLAITTDGVTSYASATHLLSANESYTTISKITVGGDTDAEIKVLGNTGALTATYLNHLPAANAVISKNLFLPTSIPNENATISWQSSDEAVMDNTGRIVTDKEIDKDITLTATIKRNNTTFTQVYNFKVSSHTNEINFQKLIQEMSPLIMAIIDDGTDATRYFLPNVGTYTNGEFTSAYDYRRDFDISETPDVSWSAYSNINLTSLTYSKLQDQTYDYITIDSTNNNVVYLNANTLSNYAKIQVTGEFSNGEEYTGYVNIVIVLGSDTELLGKAFSSVEEELDNISILGNILYTRGTSGIIGEKGDFTLPAKYGEDYTITYTEDSDIISSITAVVEDEVTIGYKFTVDPTKFNSTETSVPIQVRIEYQPDEGAPILNSKTLYVDAPAAIHSDDVGGISIFNTLKYQTFTAIGQTTNNGFSTSGGIVTDNGYDYLLIRDIVGDATYLSDYRAKNLYLTMNSIDSEHYQSPVTQVKLYTASSNNTSTTDTAAYDFVKLIQWATGNTKVLASEVISSAGATVLDDLASYRSNGEVYLNNNEIAVIEAFYKHYTNDSGTKWYALRAQSMETAPGRIYDNPELLVTVLRCLTNDDEKGKTSGWYENNGGGKYGKIYAKYLEIINRYAITTSTNEEPMAPAQEVYNSKFYYSFTETAQNNLTGTTAVSFPCKYIDASGNLVSGYCNRYAETNWGGAPSGNRQGTYAAANKKGNAAVDLYANATGAPYDSDHTKYITSAELMVLKAFWLGSLGAKTANANTNVLREFTQNSRNAIDAVLAADPVSGIYPYPDYVSGDFQYYGQAILNAFDACLAIPTYLSSNGINLLIQSFYDNFNTNGYSLKEYGSDTASPFRSVLVNSVPAVTNLDNLEGGLSFFKNLTTLDIKGNSSLYAFLGDYGLSQAFARITLTNSSLTSLTMQYVSPTWNTFDLTNIKNLDALTSIDVSNNLGIKTLNPLLNINRAHYTSIDISNIGEVFEYNEFAIDNLASATCEVTYTNAGGAEATTTTGNPSLLVNLSDIGDFVSEHLYLTNVIYNDDGTTTDVCWRIEQGNEINGQEINAGGELVTLNDIREMNMRISPYYYCTEDFTYFNFNFKEHGLYKIVIDSSDNVLVSRINLDSSDNLLYDVLPVDGVPSTDYENVSNDDPHLTIYDPHLTFSGEYSRTKTSTDTTDTVYSQDSSIISNTTNYTLNFNFHVFNFGASNYNSTAAITYRLRANGNEFRSTTANVNTDCYFVFLTENEANFVVELRNNNFHNTTDVIMDKYGITPSGTDINLGADVPTTNNTTINGYYVYSVYTQKFLTVYGFSSDPVSKFNIGKSSQKLNNRGSNVSVYTMYNVDNGKYLAQSKISTDSATDSNRIGIGTVYYYNSSGKHHNDNFCQETGNYSIFRIYWVLESNDTYTLGNTISCAENTPTLDITAGKDMEATANFNCVYIANGSTGSGSTNYRMYDTGSFLLISKDSSVYGENAKFCFLTEDEKNQLEEWYENPQEDITLGSSPSNHAYYYIYCPYTRRFISGGTTDTKGEMYTTVSSFNDAQLYFIHKSKISGSGSYIIAADLVFNNPNYINNTDSGGSNDNGISGFNAFGGVTSANYIALWKDDANTTCKFIAVDTQYEITYEVKATSATYIAYQVDYTVTKVTAHILERDISKEYKFDNFYYLNEDIAIGGVTYKAGNVIRFVCDAYYGTQYEADIEYYELTLTYYDDKDKTNNATHKHTINETFNTAEYIYYYLDALSNVQSYDDGVITYTKLTSPDEFVKYNASAKYTTHTNPTGVTVPFPTTQWIYTSTSFDSVKSNLYLDSEGANSAANATYNPSTTYYKQKYIEADVFSDEFNAIKSTLFTDTNGTSVSAGATFNKNATYYEVGYTALNSITLNTNIEETYSTISVEVPIFEYYKYGIYTNSSGTRVALNATYDSNATYYFLQGDGTYTTTKPKIYSSLVADYVSLTLDATTFEYFKHHIYKDNAGTEVELDDQYNSDITYYMDDYVVSTFKNDVLNTYRSVLYKDSTGTVLDLEETFNPNYTYYTNEFVQANGITAVNFADWKSRLFANDNGLPLASDAVFDSGMTYYKKVFIVANPEPTGNLVEDWITTKNNITRLYSHTKTASGGASFTTYVSDYGNVYDNDNYPTVYRYIGSGTENIYADPTITVSYEPIRTGSVTAENFASMKSSLYADANGTALAVDATFEQGRVYYIRTWTTVPNLKYENVTYRYNYGYYLIREDDNSNQDLNTLQWYEDQDGVNSNTAGTMDAILDEANTHFHDEEYNLWYGKHYAYNGFTMQSSKEIRSLAGNIVHGYNKGYVYRIVVNADNTAFIWQQVYTYYRKTGDTMVTEASTGAAAVGDTIWATEQCFGGFYTANKFYRVVNDDFTKTLNIIQFTDATITNTNIGYTDIVGKKIAYIRQGNYLGYAGTYELIISAVVREDNGDGTYDYTDAVRTYKIKFVGTVIW